MSKKHESGLPWAEDVAYFKTGKSSPDVWMQRTKQTLLGLGASGFMEGSAFTNDGRGVFILHFTIGPEKFRVAWPVLPVRSPQNEPAARTQAATLLHHDVKAKGISAQVLGVRNAFIGSLLLPSGKTVVEESMPLLSESSSLLRLSHSS